MAAWESGASFSRFNEQVEPSENGRRQLLFGSGLQGDLQHGRFQLEPDSGPNDGERTIFVSDDGLLVSLKTFIAWKKMFFCKSTFVSFISPYIFHPQNSRHVKVWHKHIRLHSIKCLHVSQPTFICP
jgi:hypothetical protein